MATKILQIVGNLGNEIYTQNDEPTDAKDGALWVDLDDEGIVTDIEAALAEAKASGEFKGEKGDSGVYVGTGVMPEGYNIQINPDGEAYTFHDHENKEVLNKFSEDSEGNPLYNGQDIGGSGTGLTEQQASDLAENTAQRHKHTNKDLLDAFQKSGVVGLTYEGNTIAFTYNIPSAMPASSVNLCFNNDTENMYDGYVNKAGVIEIVEEINTRFATKELVEGLSSPLRIELVEALPEAGEEGVIYLVPSEQSELNVHEEYLFVNGSFELIGSTQVDLTDYAKTADIVDDAPSQANTFGKVAGLIGNLDQRLMTVEGIEHHTHDNKEILDGFTQDTIDALQEISDKAHSHANQNTLDNIDNLFVKKTDVTTEIETALETAKANGEFKGDTPVKGTDYFTEADKAEMVETVIAKMNEKTEIVITEQSGGYWNIRGSWDDIPSITSKYTDLIPVTEGEKYTYTGYGMYQGASILWYSDKGSTLLSYEQYNDGGSSGDAQTVIVTVPTGATYARFCSYSYGTPALSVSLYEESVETSVLAGKKIIYDGDSICESRTSSAANGGAYAKIIAERTGGSYVNQAVGGGKITTRTDGGHSVVDNLANLPTDGDLYCFEGGVNDVWGSVPLGTYDMTDYTGEVDITTICGALETIFRYALNNFVGKPICFIISHKVSNINYENYKNYHDSAVAICNKYSIPYYDAYNESGLNGWNTAQSNAYLTANSNGTADGCHPNEEGYKRYYVPQLISLFERIMPTDVVEFELPAEPSYTNVLDEVGYTKGIYLSGGKETTDANAYTTGFIPCTAKSTIYLKNVTMPDESSHGNRIGLYKSDKTVINGYPITSSTGSNTVFDSDGNLTQFYIDVTDLAYIRLSAWLIDDTSIITVNEPIE